MPNQPDLDLMAILGLISTCLAVASVIPGCEQVDSQALGSLDSQGLKEQYRSGP